jgi:hypothetical protein
VTALARAVVGVVGVARGGARDFACSRGGLPTQVLGQQPDQHHRQWDFCRTDLASKAVRRGAVGWVVFVFAT